MFRNFLPICLNIDGCKILIVGGGKAACQKLRHLLKLNCRVSVVAEEALSSLKALARRKTISLSVRRFKDTDINGYDLVYACTDDLSVNRRVAYLAKQKCILCNIAGDHALSDFVSPAVYKTTKYMIAVSSFGKNPKLAVQLRNHIRKSLKT